MTNRKLHNYALSIGNKIDDWIGLCSVFRPRQHSIGYMGDSFTGQKSQTTVSNYWRRCYKRQSKNGKW